MHKGGERPLALETAHKKEASFDPYLSTITLVHGRLGADSTLRFASGGGRLLLICSRDYADSAVDRFEADETVEKGGSVSVDTPRAAQGLRGVGYLTWNAPGSTAGTEVHVILRICSRTCELPLPHAQDIQRPQLVPVDNILRR